MDTIECPSIIDVDLPLSRAGQIKTMLKYAAVILCNNYADKNLRLKMFVTHSNWSDFFNIYLKCYAFHVNKDKQRWLGQQARVSVQLALCNPAPYFRWASDMETDESTVWSTAER